MPPAGMPGYTGLSDAVSSSLLSDPEVRAACIGMDLTAVPLDLCPTLVRSKLLCTTNATLLEIDAAASGTLVADSSVDGGGKGVFATRDFEVGQTILPFTGQIVYHNLQHAAWSKDPYLAHRVYGGCPHMAPFAATAYRWGRTSVDVGVTSGFWTTRPTWAAFSGATKMCARSWPSTWPVWIVPSPWCAAGMVNDPRYTTDRPEKGKPRRAANTRYVQQWEMMQTPAQLVRCNAVRLEVIKPIKAEQELFASYGKHFRF